MRQALLNIFSLYRASSRGLMQSSSTPTMSAARLPSTPSGTTGAPGRCKARSPEYKLKKGADRLHLRRMVAASTKAHQGLQDPIRREAVRSCENVTEVNCCQESAEVHYGSAPRFDSVGKERDLAHRRMQAWASFSSAAPEASENAEMSTLRLAHLKSQSFPCPHLVHQLDNFAAGRPLSPQHILVFGTGDIGIKRENRESRRASSSGLNLSGDMLSHGPGSGFAEPRACRALAGAAHPFPASGSWSHGALIHFMSGALVAACVLLLVNALLPVALDPGNRAKCLRCLRDNKKRACPTPTVSACTVRLESCAWCCRAVAYLALSRFAQVHAWLAIKLMEPASQLLVLDTTCPYLHRNLQGRAHALRGLNLPL